ncbi:MAG: ATP synthase F1 subunit delta [Bacteroidales bacterium]|nr:MAG: ATP synthase F1 subunit delta [Bacteroidales bacterium]
MNESKISARYAKALLLLGKEQNIQEEIRADVESLSELINKTPEVRKLFEIPNIRTSLKLEIINKLFKDAFNPVMLSFLALVVKNNRELFLPSILRIYIDLFKKDNKIKSAVLTTARPVNREIRSIIKDYISKEFDSNIELSEKVDDRLIGGFILKIEDQQINASVSNHLDRIQKELLSV